jgi:hypothetical protein
MEGLEVIGKKWMQTGGLRKLEGKARSSPPISVVTKDVLAKCVPYLIRALRR